MWLSVTLTADAARAEALSDALLARGALSVSIDDADAGTEAETPQFGEPGSSPAPLWRRSRVTALFEAACDVAPIVAAAAREAGLDGAPPVQVTRVAEQNWVRLTQSQFEPIRIHERMWIVPSWHAAPDPQAINLVMDPGMAFGTGSHPTTRLCLEWLCAHVRPGTALLDYGCGSGILAIAAARLGAGPVAGTDIDANALAAAAANADRNGVELALVHSEQRIVKEFDIVVANILANPLCVLAPLLTGLVRPGGHLVLSGILDAQAAQVQAAYLPGVPLDLAGASEGWVLLAGQRTPMPDAASKAVAR